LLREKWDYHWLDPVVSAASALTEIARYPEGAQAVVNADVFDALPKRLYSESTDVRAWTANIFGILAKHDLGLELILNWNICSQLVLLLR
jgi:hypothetical protein